MHVHVVGVVCACTHTSNMYMLHVVSSCCRVDVIACSAMLPTCGLCDMGRGRLPLLQSPVLAPKVSCDVGNASVTARPDMLRPLRSLLSLMPDELYFGSGVSRGRSEREGITSGTPCRDATLATSSTQGLRPVGSLSSAAWRSPSQQVPGPLNCLGACRLWKSAPGLPAAARASACVGRPSARASMRAG